MKRQSRKLLVVGIAFSLIAGACVVPAAPPTATPIPPSPTAAPTLTPAPTPTLALTSTPEPATEQSLVYDGVWQSKEFNFIIDIQGNRGTSYEITQMSCLLALAGDIRREGAATFFGIIKLTLAGDKLAVLPVDGPLYIPLSKIAALPERCKDGEIADRQDPVVNFEVFWHTFQENYPFFDVRGVDWQKQYAMFRPQVKADMDRSALFELLSEMIAPLNDAHVWLHDLQNGNHFDSTKGNPKWGYNGMQQEKIIADYLGGYDKIKPVGSLWYGRLNGTIGYIYAKSLEGFTSEYNDNPAAAAKAIDQVIRDLSDVKAMIVDMRFNEYGQDAVSLALASRFADQRRLAFSYQSGSEESAPLV